MSAVGGWVVWLVTTDGTKAYLHYGKLIRAYVRMFARTDPKEALQYFCTIRDTDFKYVWEKLVDVCACCCDHFRPARGASDLS